MKKQFKAESQRLLDMMINSIYTHKEIFLREIISNASDAIDKMCYLALTDPSVGESRSDYEIIITLDKENRTLTVSDNGIGMDEQELEKNLGTIAFSGSSKFSEQLEKDSKEAKTTAEDHTGEVDIIGQFGVGFYSAFMVADKVEVVSKHYGADKAYRWVSEGAGGYSIEEAERDGHGTDVIMHIRQDGETEDEFSQYMREYPIYKLVKKYSDYIRFPIKMLMPQPRIKEGSDPQNPEYEGVWEYEVFNSMVPLWQRRRSEVTKDEYDAFYKSTFQDDMAPLETLTVSVEGLVSYNALMFIPELVPNKYYTDEFTGGLQLYSSGVLIMDKCKELLPEYFSWLSDLEYNRMQLPKPDLVIYLETTLEISVKRMRRRENATGTHADIHEKNTKYLEKCLQTAELACDFFGWKRIACLDELGKERHLSEKNDEIYSEIRKFLGQ